MGSLIEELEAREAAARERVGALESQIAELTVRLEAEREAWSRLRVTRETVAEVVAEMSAADGASAVRSRPRMGRSCAAVATRTTPSAASTSSRVLSVETACGAVCGSRA